jgi:hypothetical protein
VKRKEKNKVDRNDANGKFEMEQERIKHFNHDAIKYVTYI